MREEFTLKYIFFYDTDSCKNQVFKVEAEDSLAAVKVFEEEIMKHTFIEKVIFMDSATWEVL